MKKVLSALAALAIPLSILPMTQNPVKATTALYQDIRVDADCGGTDCGSMTLASANTTRKLAVTADGTIYAVFYGSNGIWVTKSTDRGASFASGVQVSSTNSEPEIGAAANGTLYVIWRDRNFVVSKSTDGGATWGTPVDTGTAGTMGPAHMAVDGDYIYAVDSSGSVLMYSHDAGATWGSTSTGFILGAFADVRVDRLTHDVYVVVDNPSVFWFKSTDRGVTLSSANSTGKSVYYSVGAMTSDGTNLYFYMAGSGANLERIDLGGGAALTQTVTASSDSQGRSLAADNCGNVVSGHKSGADLYFQYSTDSGATFSSQELVVSAGDRANASINETNGDVLFLYEKSGDIFLTTYSGLLTGGSNCYVATPAPAEPAPAPAPTPRLSTPGAPGVETLGAGSIRASIGGVTGATAYTVRLYGPTGVVSTVSVGPNAGFVTFSDLDATVAYRVTVTAIGDSGVLDSAESGATRFRVAASANTTDPTAPSPVPSGTEPVFVTDDDAPLLERQPGTSGAILNGVPTDTRQSAGDRTVIQRFIAGQPAGASNPVTVNEDNQLPSLITDDDNNPVPIPDTNIVIVETDTTALALAAQRSDGQPGVIRSDGALVVDRGRVGTAGYGFTPSRVGEIVLFSEPQLVGTFTTDATGAFTAQFDLPAGIEPGPHTIVLALGDETKAVGIFVEVEVPAPATLPVTGNTTPINWIILTLTLGAWTLLATRRRTSV